MQQYLQPIWVLILMALAGSIPSAALGSDDDDDTSFDKIISEVPQEQAAYRDSLYSSSSEATEGENIESLRNITGLDPLFGLTDLHRAAHYGNYETVRSILTDPAHQAAAASTPHYYGYITPRDLAAAAGHTAIVELMDGLEQNNFIDIASLMALYEIPFDRNNPKDLYNLLYTLVASGDESRVHSLLNLGADPNFVRESSIHPSPLWLAISRRDSLMTELLLSRGADLGYTVVIPFLATRSVLQLIIDNHYEGPSAFFNAIYNYLESQSTLNPVAARQWRLFNEGIVRSFLTRHNGSGFNLEDSIDTYINDVNRCVEIVFHRNRPPELMRKVIKNSLLYFAIILNDELTTRALLALGADVNALDSITDTLTHSTSTTDFSVLHAASMRSRKRIVALLLQRGARADRRESRNNTPLHIAAYKNNIGAIRALLETDHVADFINLRNYANQTALEVALSRGHVKAARLIESYLNLPLTPLPTEDEIHDNYMRNLTRLVGNALGPNFIPLGVVFNNQFTPFNLEPTSTSASTASSSSSTIESAASITSTTASSSSSSGPASAPSAPRGFLRAATAPYAAIIIAFLLFFIQQVAGDGMPGSSGL